MRVFEGFSESAENSTNSGRNCSRRDLSSPNIFPIQRRRRSRHFAEPREMMVMDEDEKKKFSKLRSTPAPTTPTYSEVLHNLVIFLVIMMNLARSAESLPQTQESIDGKIKMFLESHCTMQNQTLEHTEFVSIF